MELNKAIKSRHSVRKFKDKSPDWRDIIECIEVMRYAPMAGNNFTVRTIIVNEPDKIQIIADAAEQPFIATAKYIVVVCSDYSRLINAYGKRGEKYGRQQAAAAIQNFLLKIEEKGLSTCWVGHLVEGEIKDVLKIPDEIELEAVFPIGYELKKPVTAKEKTYLDNILYFNTFRNKKMVNPPRVD